MHHLGEWIEFQTIIGKQKTNDGSKPVAQRLARRRRGMVVGVRNLYDTVTTGDGAPPRLRGAREVLVVAVSLHRSYRVLPKDVIQAGLLPPERRRRGRV